MTQALTTDPSFRLFQILHNLRDNAFYGVDI